MEYLPSLVFFLFVVVFTFGGRMAYLQKPRFVVWAAYTSCIMIFGAVLGKSAVKDLTLGTFAVPLLIGASFLGGGLAELAASWIERQRSREAASPAPDEPLVDPELASPEGCFRRPGEPCPEHDPPQG